MAIADQIGKLKELDNKTLKQNIDNNFWGLNEFNKKLENIKSKTSWSEKVQLENIQQDISNRLWEQDNQETTQQDSQSSSWTEWLGTPNFQPPWQQWDITQTTWEKTTGATWEGVSTSPELSDFISKLDKVDTNTLQQRIDEKWGIGEINTKIDEAIGQSEWSRKTQLQNIKDTLNQRFGGVWGDTGSESTGWETWEEDRSLPDLWVDTDSWTETDLPQANENIETIENSVNQMSKNLDETMTQVKDNIKNIEWVTEQTKQTMDTALENRRQNVEESFQDIKEQYGGLRQQVLDTYDKNVERRAQQRATWLAEKWLLTDEQASQAAQQTINQYKDQAELKKAEIEEKINQWMIQARKEKQKMTDAIEQQRAADAQTKRQMTQQVENAYNQVLQQYQNSKQQLSQFNLQNILQQTQPQISLEKSEQAAQVQQQVKNAIDQKELERANNSEEDRVRFLVNSIRNVSPDLIPFASDKIKNKMQEGWFMEWDAQEQFINILSESSNEYMSWQQSSSWWGSSSMKALQNQQLINQYLNNNSSWKNSE